MAGEVKRVRYFNGQLLREQDFFVEQDFHTKHMQEHQRWLHTPGVATGFEVTGGATPSSVLIQPGTAYDDLGQRIARAGSFDFDLTSTFNPGTSTESAEVYVTVSWEAREGKELGDTDNTRFIEEAKIEKLPAAPGNSRRQLVLAKITRGGTNPTSVTGIDTTVRLRSGVAVGDLEVPSLSLSRSDIQRVDWAKFNLGAAKQAQLTGSLNVTQGITASGRNLTGELDTLNLHKIDTGNPHKTTAAQIDGTTSEIVKQINQSPGGGVINTARVQFLNEKLGGEFHSNSTTLSTTGERIISVTNRDMRGRVIIVRGWVSANADTLPALYSAAAPARAWDPQVPGTGLASREAWAYCKPSATAGSAQLFTLTEGTASVIVSLDFTTTAMNLRFNGPVNHSFGYVFQLTWQDF